MIELSWALIFTAVMTSVSSVHPVVFSLSLIFLTLGLSPLISLTLSKWMAYAIILIFLGGMMVIFIYASTLAGNEKLVFSPEKSLWCLPLILSLGFTPTFDYSNDLISHLYSLLSAPLLLFLTLFLLLTLFVVIFLAQGFKGALMKYN